MPDIFEGGIQRHQIEHKFDRKLYIELHHTGDVAGHAEILKRLGEIMSAVSDFITAQKQFNKDTGDGIDKIVTSLGNIDGDVKSLNDQIANLTVSPADAADLAQLKADGLALGTKVKAASDIAAALDAKTPPVAPPTP